MRENVKIKYIGFWSDFEDDLRLNRFQLHNVIEKHYGKKIVSDNADYIVCSTYPEFYEYCNYDQIRIMYSGENVVPDFNLVDYAVSRYPIEFGDRHFYLPGCIDPSGHALVLGGGRKFTRNMLANKEYFANFIYSHESEGGIRGDFFKALSNYKRVESCGTYLNNTNGVIVNLKDSSKTDFQRKTKFTLCFESTKHDGFITEKITDAFYANTIPIYYGSDDISKIFNSKAFINVSDYEDFESVIDKIIELDSKDDAYIAMMNEPIFMEQDYPQKKMADFEEWVCHIFEQPYDQAYRRSKVFQAKQIEDYLISKRIKNRKKRFQIRFYG